MSSRGTLARWARPIVYLGTNPLSLAGAVLTTSAALTMVAFWALEVLHGAPIHPYAGILLFLVLPAVFVGGLLLIPIGLVWRRRRLRAQRALPGEYPRIDLNRPGLRRADVPGAGRRRDQHRHDHDLGHSDHLHHRGQPDR